MTQRSVDRRQFLVAVATAGGGLAIGVAVPVLASADGATGADKPVPEGRFVDATRFSPFLEIAPTGVITITGPQSEMGQGIHDGLPKLLAEELDADWERVEIRLPTGDDAFVHPRTKRHRTANSDSTTTYGEMMRRAGAGAREMLVAAAAARWAVPPQECRTAGSVVSHPPSGRRADYGELAAAAAGMPVPTAPRLKPPAEYVLVGRATRRKDSPAKVTGRALFGIDVRQPGMLYAVLCRPPTVVGKVSAFSREAALSQPGVVDAVAVTDGVALLARSTWHAMRAAAALAEHPATVFDVGAAQAVDSDGLRARLRAALDDDARAAPARSPGVGVPPDLAPLHAAFEGASRRLEWTYEVPYLAHAALEPLCATALVTGGAATLWAPTQQPDRTRDVMAQVTGLPRAACTLQVTFLGGGFGRKWETDFVRQAMEIARARPGVPVKLTWTREQDFRHDRFRPAHMARSRVALDGAARLVALHARIVGSSLWRFQSRGPLDGYADPFATGALYSPAYALPTRHIDWVETAEPVPIGMWRSVAASMNGFFGESTIDDIAAATGRDPLALRLELCAGDARAVAVLRKAADLVGWELGATRTRPGPGGGRRYGRGISLSSGFGSHCAQVVEVEVAGRRVHITRIVCVFDCGDAIDPRNVEAQISGGIVWGLSAAIDGRSSFAAGAVREDNFHTAPVLRFAATPRIEVHLSPSAGPIGGVGEASVPGVAPALAAAIAQATGERPRRLPLVEHGYAFV